MKKHNSWQQRGKAITGLLAVFLLSISITPAIADDAARHIPGIFVGVLHADGEDDAVIGLEYEYKISHLWGLGIVYEVADDAHHGDGVESILAMAFIHPHAGWRIGIGVGEEEVGDHHSENLARIGVAYDFHVGHFGIAPAVNVDSVDGETNYVYGVGFTIPF